jgi:hypothetical protein
MASGPAIDEQYDARWGPSAAHPSSTAAAHDASGGPPPDFDPNDLPPAGSTSYVQPSQASRPSQMLDWDDLDDDEEEFFGR